MEKRECAGLCQHTTCSSCLVLRRPECPQACAHTDYVCLHRFGRCVHNQLKGQEPAVCHQTLQVSELTLNTQHCHWHKIQKKKTLNVILLILSSRGTVRDTSCVWPLPVHPQKTDASVEEALQRDPSQKCSTLKQLFLIQYILIVVTF